MDSSNIFFVCFIYNFNFILFIDALLVVLVLSFGKMKQKIFMTHPAHIFVQSNALWIENKTCN